MLSATEENQISLLFDPWVSMADNDDYYERMKDFDPNDWPMLHQLVILELSPWILKLPSQECLKSLIALDKFQTLEHSIKEGIWNSNLMPFSLPQDPQPFIDKVREILLHRLDSSGS